MSALDDLSPALKLAAQHLLRKSRWHGLEYVFWAGVFALLVFVPTKALLWNEILILALFALSLDLVLGFGGIVSLGHAAFFGLGAYGAGLLGKYGFGDPLLGLILAGGLAALAGFLSSFLLLRGSDLTRLMVTLGVAQLLAELANRLAFLTGGADGLQGVTNTPILGLFDFDFLGRVASFYSFAVLFVLFFMARRLVHSPFGLSLQAVKSNSLRARAIGISPASRLVAIYTVAAFYAGIAGALSAQTTQFVSLDVLDFHRSADVMLMLILGGTGTLYGALAGAVIFRVLQNYISSITPQYWEFWIGLVLVILIMIGRERLDDTAIKIGRRLKHIFSAQKLAIKERA